MTQTQQSGHDSRIGSKVGLVLALALVGQLVICEAYEEACKDCAGSVSTLSPADDNAPSYLSWGVQTAEAQADFVPNLPGFGPPTTNTFAGYMNVVDVTGRNVSLFYILVEAQNDPENAPLTLWQNGGPGCSSLIGFLEENGPYRPKPGAGGTQLQKYDFAWNRVSNMVYLEVPGGVGYSRPLFDGYPKGTQPRDDWVATDAFQFLKGFMVRFPMYRGRPLWLSGESYAGHYTPLLASRIIAKPENLKLLNLQGYLVGNAYTHGGCYDNYASLEYLYDVGMLSPLTLMKYAKACKLSPTCSYGKKDDESRKIRNFRNRSAFKRDKTAATPLGTAVGSEPDICNSANGDALAEVGDINLYDIFADICLPTTPAQYTSWNGSSSSSSSVDKGAAAQTADSDYHNPCIDDDVTAYFNRKDVKEALHVTDVVQGTSWVECNDPLYYAWSVDDIHGPIQPVIKNVLNSGNYSVLYYGGDQDSVVAVKGTIRWLLDLFTPTSEYVPWKRRSGQQGGHYIKFDKLVHTTVRGAGHLVPLHQGPAAFDMFHDFITNRTCMFNSC